MLDLDGFDPCSVHMETDKHLETIVAFIFISKETPRNKRLKSLPTFLTFVWIHGKKMMWIKNFKIRKFSLFDLDGKYEVRKLKVGIWSYHSPLLPGS